MSKYAYKILSAEKISVVLDCVIFASVASGKPLVILIFTHITNHKTLYTKGLYAGLQTENSLVYSMNPAGSIAEVSSI